jgi:hypothetical protein
MTRQAKKTKAQILRETYEGQYGDFSIEQLDEEIRRALKMKLDTSLEKKETNKTFNDQLKEYDERMLYCMERIDHLRHEAQVAHVLETER